MVGILINHEVNRNEHKMIERRVEMQSLHRECQVAYCNQRVYNKEQAGEIKF